jgi:hypothetical protein
MGKGKIYIMTNDAMPGIIKIGTTTKDIKKRMSELDKTGIPLPFRCHFAVEVEDYEIKERKIHDAFSDHRLRKNREFFKLAPERVVAILTILGGREILGDDSMIGEDGPEQENILVGRKIRENFTFSVAKIPIGAELVFTRDENEKCRVISNNKVEYKGKEYSLSPLANELLSKRGIIGKVYRERHFSHMKRKFLPIVVTE